jgi:hypothetical protein
MKSERKRKISSKRKSGRKVKGMATRRKGKREETQKKTGKLASKRQISAVCEEKTDR